MLSFITFETNLHECVTSSFQILQHNITLTGSLCNLNVVKGNIALNASATSSSEDDLHNERKKIEIE